MKKIQRTVLAILLMVLPLGTHLAAQDRLPGGILYGPNWGCAVTAPEDWLMDMSTWASNGIFALFYQKDQTLGPAIPIVYVNTQLLNADTDEEMEKYVAWDLANVTSNPANTVAAVDLGPVVDQKLLCYTFNLADRQYETIAYLRYKDTCFLVILATHDKAQIAPTMAKFKEVIQSMRFMEKQ